eukprot:m.72825 g.72825  ORF g.72825 m.72825 type:complete len:113 (+) comp35818_c0_seq4:1217-1555(+)
MSSWYCKIIDCISQTFGNEIWEQTMIVLAKANMLRASDRNDKEILHKAAEHIQRGYCELIKKYASKNFTETIPIVPAGSWRDRILADGKPWFPEFLVTAIETASIECRSFCL